MRSKDASLNEEEFERVWKAVRGSELDRLLFSLMAELGLRLSETVHLKESWVDFQSFTITVPSEDGNFSAKNESANRTIPFEELRKSRRSIMDYFDFHDEIPIAKRTVETRVKKWGREAEIKHKIFPHALRATAASRFARAGMSAQGLKEIMGWATLDTARHYIRDSGRAARSELKRIKDELNK